MGSKDIIRLDDNRTDVPRPVHVRACRTSLLAADSWEMSTETCNYEFLPCPNQFRVKNSFLEKKQDLKNDVFILTWEDYDASLSCKYRKFLAIMETGLHKNEQGNWEMPLPFPSKDPRLPNNRSQALKWPHSHLEKKASDGKTTWSAWRKSSRKATPPQCQ